jgi:dCMP deaminase
MSRVSWDQYFMNIAVQAATRATCNRKHVGTVIVKDRNVLTTGYNGSVRGEPHCDDVGHDLVNNSCQRVVHSEMNAIAQAARRGIALDGATLYVTASPCWPCFRLLVNAGIVRVVYAEAFYRDVELITEVAKRQNIELVHLKISDPDPTPVP